MPINLVPLDLPSDQEALVGFLLGNAFPFHVSTSPTLDDIEQRIADGNFTGPDHAAFWVDSRTEGRIGLVILEDLADHAPLFDLRLRESARGRGLGVSVVRALATLVFETFPRVSRLEGQTREDNIAMRKTFLRAGFVKEAHYREAWPVNGSLPLASVAYAMLRRDWETGHTTALVWDDLVV